MYRPGLFANQFLSYCSYIYISAFTVVHFRQHIHRILKQGANKNIPLTGWARNLQIPVLKNVQFLAHPAAISTQTFKTERNGFHLNVERVHKTEGLNSDVAYTSEIKR